MKILSFDLKTYSSTTAETEILYSIASARATGADFVGLNIVGENPEKIKLAALKILRSAKKQEKILLFAPSYDLSSTTTEAQYLNNKYPDLINSCSADVETIFVKI